MKKIASIVICACFTLVCAAQQKKGVAIKENDSSLPELNKSIITAQENVQLFTENMGNNSKEHDVNSIILDMEKYIDSLHGIRLRKDVLLNKYFAPLRLYFLTTSNKTTVATFFLYPDVPYVFCRYNDTALALHITAVKNGNTYNLGKMTEKRIASSALDACLLPSLKALDEFKEGELKYIAISTYYGSKDSREGAGTEPVTAYCMTLVARLADIQQYNAGLITAKGLAAMSDIYLSDAEDAHELRMIKVNVQ